MPTNKDFKRLVRARMQKTGESYTTARAQLLHRKPEAPSPAPSQYARLAGRSDQAHTWPHRDIARYVHEKFKVDGWWAQTVTVGYERIKGLRAIGQRRDGGFEASKSKTFTVPLARLYRAWSDARTRTRWLPGVDLTIRTATRNKSMRITWPDRTSVALGFAGKSAGKSQVAIQHQKLPDKPAATRMKEFWAERLAALGAVLQMGG